MAGDDLWLIAWTAACFLGLGAFGYLRPDKWVWRWADALYYPLAAAGVVLLFFASVTDRTLLKIETARAAAEREWKDRPARPSAEALSPSSREMVAVRFRWFVTERDLGEVCTRSTTEGCMAHSEHAEIMREAFGDFDPATIPADDAVSRARAEEEFCRRSFVYLDKLDQDGTLALGAYGKLKSALAQRTKGGNLEAIKGALAETISREQAEFRRLVERDYLTFVDTNLRVQAEYALSLFDQLEWCALRNPGQTETLRTVDRWQAKEARIAGKRGTFERQLANVKKDQSKTPAQMFSRALQQQWWPFILVLALGIKFGKAMAGVEEDISDLCARIRHWARSRAARLRKLGLRREKNGGSEDG